MIRKNAIPGYCRILVAYGLLSGTVIAGDPGYSDYTAWADWARLRVGARAGLATSYDRGGGNLDYCQYESPVGLIYDEIVTTIKTIEGPGVVYRFWMPHVTADLSFVVRMYFDGETTPRLDTTSDTLFAGGFEYFTAPLVDTFGGGQVCYEPIPFSQSLLIETVNHQIPTDAYSAHRHYYQYGYQSLGAGANVSSYTGILDPQDQAARSAMVALFDNVGQHPAGSSPTATRLDAAAAQISGGGTLPLADVAGPAIVRQINISMDSANDADLDGLRLLIHYDDEALPAIDVSVADFFGAGHLRDPYRSLPLGTDSADGFYCYWPLPFRKSLRVELKNTTASPISIDSAVVEYEPGPLDAEMCYLRVEEYSETWDGSLLIHPFFSATGRGHYVGNLLYVDQDFYEFRLLENDEFITVDGTDLLHGTGLEDAYNGGYYYNWVAVKPNEPEGIFPQSAHRPLNGILYVHRESGIEYSRADQYRWMIADRVPFANSIDVHIEVIYSQLGSRWTSVAFWYEQPPVPGDSDGDGDVDLRNFAAMQPCFGQQTVECLASFDHDANGTVDLTDVGQFVAIFTGAWE